LTWNIADLPPFPVHVYGILTDGSHAPQQIDYAPRGVLSHPEIVAGVNITDGGTPQDLQQWLVTLQAVKQASVVSIAPGANPGDPSVVTTASAHGLQPGDVITFNGLAGVNVSNGQTYYVRSVTTNTFTFARGPGLPPVSDASAGPGAVYRDKEGAAQVQRLTDASGHVSLNPGAIGYYRITVTPKSDGFQAVPSTGQDVSAIG